MKRAAFTLIELLVVIAIIALLVSILLPSLSKAKQLANSVVCASNQKAIMTGIHMYAGDHNGMLPYKTMPDGGPSAWWMRYGFIGKEGTCSSFNGTKWTPYKTTPPLNPYIDLPDTVDKETNPGVAFCPADTTKVTSSPDIDYWGTSYVYNAGFGGINPAIWSVTGLYGLSLDQIMAAAETVCVADSSLEASAANMLPSDPRHDEQGNKINMGMLDGHVENFNVLVGDVEGLGWTLDAFPD